MPTKHLSTRKPLSPEALEFGRLGGKMDEQDRQFFATT